MRLRYVVAAAVGVGRTAIADPTYPESDVDRPLLMYGGMTSLDLGLDLPTYAQTTVDASGNAMTSTTTLGHYRYADVVFLHSFGSVEIGGRILDDVSGPYVQGQALAYLGPIPGALSITAQVKVSEDYSVYTHDYTETVGYLYKLAVVPHHLALLGAASLGISEFALKPTAMSPPAPPAGTYVGGSVGVTAEVQVTTQFAIAIGASAYAPIHRPAAADTGSASLGTSTSLLYALRHWDFYGQLGLGDVTDSRTPFASIGVVHRWGG